MDEGMKKESKSGLPKLFIDGSKLPARTSEPVLIRRASSLGITVDRSSFTCNSVEKAELLSNLMSGMRENIRVLKLGDKGDQAVLCPVLQNMLQMIKNAWSTPAIGRDLAHGLCEVLRTDGGLDALLQNCDVDADVSRDLRLGSAQVLAESLTVRNREYAACNGGLEIVVQLAKRSRDDPELSLAAIGILESLFKQSETTCATLIHQGGLDTVLYACRMTDVPRLRRCAAALANLAIYGGADNQQEMIEHRVPEWLFPLAFSDDDSTRYYAFLAISALGSNATLEAAVVRSGTLRLVEPFVRSHDPTKFAQSDRMHMQSQSPDWLRRLVSLLFSWRDETQSLAAFHFAMAAGVYAEQGKLEVIVPLIRNSFIVTNT